MKKEEAIERLKKNIAAAEFYAGMVQNTNVIENELKDIEAMNMAIEALSAKAEQVTGKLKNPCDSLLTDDSEECKEQKSKLDLISRQGMINLLMKRADELKGITGDLGGACSGAARLIERFPSAQAEKFEIIKCKDCKYYKAKQGGLSWENSRRYCNRSVTLATNLHDFCSFAERREE